MNRHPGTHVTSRDAGPRSAFSYPMTDPGTAVRQLRTPTAVSCREAHPFPRPVAERDSPTHEPVRDTCLIKEAHVARTEWIRRLHRSRGLQARLSTAGPCCQLPEGTD